MKKKILKYLIFMICAFCIIGNNDVEAGYNCVGDHVLVKTYDTWGTSSSSYKCDYPSFEMTGWTKFRKVEAFEYGGVLHLCYGANGAVWSNDGKAVAGNHNYSKKVDVQYRTVENGKTVKKSKSVYVCPIVYMGEGLDRGTFSIGQKYYSFVESVPKLFNENVTDALICVGTELHNKWLNKNENAISDTKDALNNIVSNGELKLKTVKDYMDPGGGYNIKELESKQTCSVDWYEMIKEGETLTSERATRWFDKIESGLEELSKLTFLEESKDYFAADSETGERFSMPGSTLISNVDLFLTLNGYADNITKTCNSNCGKVTSDYCNSDTYKKLEASVETFDKIQELTIEKTRLITDCGKILELLDKERYEEIENEIAEYAADSEAELIDLVAVGKVGKVDILGSDDLNYKTCSALLDDDLEKVLKWALAVVRIGAPIVLIVMITIDFGQAVISNDQDAVKKATSKAIKRIIAALALFFIPYIVELLLDMIGITGGSCGL